MDRGRRIDAMNGLLAFAAAHPFVTTYVVGMILTTALSKTVIHDRGGNVLAGYTWALRIARGIFWPVSVPMTILTKIVGPDRALAWFMGWLARRDKTATFAWRPPGLDHDLPGRIDEYPNIDARHVRDGRQIGKWSLLLVEFPESGWGCVGKRAPDGLYAGVRCATEEEARFAFKWTRVEGGLLVCPGDGDGGGSQRSQHVRGQRSEEPEGPAT